MSEMTEEAALDKLAAWCSVAEHCESEAVDKLMKWGIDPVVQSRIFQKLKKDNFLDETRYCRAFVNDKFRFQKWGRKKIGEALYLKKINRGSIDEALSLIDSVEYAEMLQALLKAKNRSLHETDEYQRRAKLYRFAMSRGFESKVISQFIDLDEVPEVD